MNAKTRSTLRIVLSSSALALFVLYLIDGLRWGMRETTDLIPLIPYALLLIFALLERKTERINKRLYLWGIFISLAGAYILTILYAESDFYAHFRSFLWVLPWDFWDISAFFFGILLAMSFLVTLAYKSILMIYAGGFTLLSVTAMVYSFFEEIQYTMPLYEDSWRLLVDVLFYAALFFFYDLMTDENESELVGVILAFLAAPIFGNPLRHMMDEEAEEYEECEAPLPPDRENNPDHYAEYQRILSYAIYARDRDVLSAAAVLEILSRKRITDARGELFSSEFVAQQLETILRYAQKLNEKEEDFIAPGTMRTLAQLIGEREEPLFMVNAVTFSCTLHGFSDPDWYCASHHLQDVLQSESAPAASLPQQTETTV